MRIFTRRSFIRGISLAAGTLWQWPASARPAQPAASAATDKPELWYRAPARSWSEALPVGNGRLGGMVFGDPYCERILLNEETFWSGEPKSFDKPVAPTQLWSMRNLLVGEDGSSVDEMVAGSVLSKINESYQPLAFLEVLHEEAPAESPNYRRSLNLRDGIHTVEAGARGERVFVSAPDQVMVVQLTSASPAGLRCTAKLGSSMHHSLRIDGNDALLLQARAPAHVVPQQAGNAIGAVTWDDASREARGMRATVALCAIDQTGGQRSLTQDGLRVEGASAITLLVSAATSYAGPRTSPSRAGRDATALALATLGKARARGGTATLEARHLNDHRGLFDRADLRLGDASGLSALPTDERLLRFAAGGADPGLAALYFQMGRYLTMGSSRPGSLPATSQGIWSHRMRPARCSAWSLNSDLPVSYWLAEVGNLPECTEPLVALARQLRASGEDTARLVYGAPGWVAHTSADLWCSTAPDADATAAAIWKSGGAWLCQHLWEHYRFSGDQAFLRVHYPLLRGASLFFLDHMSADRDGWLGMFPESSLANAYRMSSGHVAYSALGPSMSNAIVRELLRNTAAAAALFGIDSDLQTRMLAVAGQMRPPAVTRTGELAEWGDSSWVPQLPPNPQVPQVWALMPGREITPAATPELAGAARKSLLHRAPWQDDAGGWMGGWYANALARLGDEQTAYRVVELHLRTAVQPNFLSTACTQGQDFAIAGNLGIAAAIAEMLLQSHGEEIHFLPALPSAWSTGSFRGLRARGGLEVDLAWNNQRATRAALRASTGGEAVLRAPKNQAVARVSGARNLQRLGDNCVRFETEPGGVYEVGFA